MEEMVQLFSLQGIGRSNAKFNREKLLAFNTEAASTAPSDRLVRAMRDYLVADTESPLHDADDAALATLLHMKKGFRTLREVDEVSRFFFARDDSIAYDPDAVEKVLRKNNSEGLSQLQQIRAMLSEVPDWSAVSLNAAVKAYCEQKQLGLNKVAQPIRIAISGGTISPPIFESLEFLGRERTLQRIDRCLSTLIPSG